MSEKQALPERAVCECRPFPKGLCVNAGRLPYVCAYCMSERDIVGSMFKEYNAFFGKLF